jgi:multiple sugar transport system permease protein
MRSLFLVTYAIPMVVSAQVFRWMLDGRGLVNWVLQQLHLQTDPTFWLSDLKLALPALVVVQIWLGVPFTMVNLMAGLSTIPRELHEAAAIDGAGAWQRFRDITWPLLRPVALASAVLSLIFWFKTFDLVWITTQGGPGTATEILPTLAYRTAFQTFDFGHGAAILNVVFLACFVLSLLYILSLRREARYT